MKKLYFSFALLAGLALSSCNDSFLDKAPITSLTEENAFQSYDNFKAFAWPLYEVFSNSGMFGTAINGTGDGSTYVADKNAGWMYSRGYHLTGNPYAFGRITSVASGNGWNFGDQLRRANILLSHIDGSDMTQAQKDHWRAVGYFFHSYWYMELIDRFGDVPWVESPLNDESEERFAPRMPRKEVADKVLGRLIWAEENIGDFESVDGPNTINRDCVRALLSRFTLREATWRKYHELGDYQDYLSECVRVSELLMNDYPTLYQGTDGQPAAGYGEMWTTEDLGKVSGVILYFQFVDGLKYHNFSALEHMDSGNAEMSQQMIDLYLCKDGKSIAKSDLYEGDKAGMYATFRNRDPRLYHMVMPPYKVNKLATSKWEYTDDPADREYIDIMGANTSCSNPGVGMKRLPAQNWTADLVPSVPNLMDGNGATGFVRGWSGYYVWKNTDCWETNKNGGVTLNTSDKPIFKIEEVLLNYAEAKWELNQFGNTEANKSINLLRRRAGVADMVVSEINADFDPNRGYWYPKGNTTGEQVDPVLWEIRRERIVELVGEGFGFYDIRRWRMAPWFLNRQNKGAWVKKSDIKEGSSSQYFLDEATGNPVGMSGNMTEGYIYLEPDPIKAGEGWQERYYLYQVPTTEILLNPNLTQNPGWEE